MNAGNPSPAQELQKQVGRQEEHYNFWNNVWAFLANFTLYGAAIFSAVAAMIPNLSITDQTTAKNIATVCATLAALLTTMAASGGFQRQWHMNRVSRDRVRALPAVDQDNLDNVKTKLNQISEIHDEVLYGTGTNIPANTTP